MKELEKYREEAFAKNVKTYYTFVCPKCGKTLFIDFSDDVDVKLFNPSEKEYEYYQTDDNGKFVTKIGTHMVSEDAKKDEFSFQCCECGENIVLLRDEFFNSVTRVDVNGYDHIKIELNDTETEAARAFMDEHKECSKQHKTAIGGNFSYNITPTSIGDAVDIICNCCGEKKNITDYDCW